VWADVEKQYVNITKEVVMDFLGAVYLSYQLDRRTPPATTPSFWKRPLLTSLRELNLSNAALDTGAAERLAGDLQANSVSLKNLKRLSVKNNCIRVNGLLALWDLFVSTRQSRFAHDWSGNFLDPGGREAGLLSAQSTLQNPQLILNDEEEVSGGSREGWVQVNLRLGLSFLFRCTEVACLPAGGPSQTTRDGNDCGEPRQTEQPPRKARRLHAEGGVALGETPLTQGGGGVPAVDQQRPVSQALSELEVILERSREGILKLGLDDGNVGEGDAEHVGQMVLRRLQKAQSTARGRRWAVENVTADWGSTSCLQGINASQTSFALKMLLQVDACLHMRELASQVKRQP